MNKKSFGIFIGLLFLPVFAHAAIDIHEIAWMGTTKGSTNEWIELYNNGDASVDVTGWKIYTKDKGIKETALSDNIASKGFYILERTDDTTLPDIVADTIYTGDLSNSGEDLILVDNLGTIVQELNYVGGWPAGDNTTKDTMQWDGSKWITANPTPKAQTVGFINDSSNIVVPQVVANVVTSGGGGSSYAAIVKKNTPHIEFNFPENIYTHISYDFGATPILEYMTPSDGYFVWNMGDGAFFKKTRNEPINYSYQYPGEYIINFAYYNNNYEKTPVLKGKKVIDVVDPGILLTTTDNNNALQIKNTTTRDADISGWIITQGTQSVAMPDMFVINAGNTVTIPKNILGFDTISQVVMTTPNNTFVASNSYSTPTIVQKQKNFVPVAVNNNIKKVINSEVLGASVIPVAASPITEEKPITQNRTKKIIFGAVLLTVIGLLILLERFMVQKE